MSENGDAEAEQRDSVMGESYPCWQHSQEPCSAPCRRSPVLSCQKGARAQAAPLQFTPVTISAIFPMRKTHRDFYGSLMALSWAEWPSAKPSLCQKSCWAVLRKGWFYFSSLLHSEHTFFPVSECPYPVIEYRFKRMCFHPVMGLG